MKTSELMLDFLKKQGFLPEVEEHGISFNYQMKAFIYWIHDDDNEFFQLTLPGIFKANEANLDAVLRATNYVNSHLKVVKANVMNEEIVWLFFEILLEQSRTRRDCTQSIERPIGCTKHILSEDLRRLNHIKKNSFTSPPHPSAKVSPSRDNAQSINI